MCAAQCIAQPQAPSSPPTQELDPSWETGPVAHHLDFRPRGSASPQDALLLDAVRPDVVSRLLSGTHAMMRAVANLESLALDPSSVQSASS